MARRHGPEVSLFPFMSVLACTIGALTLLLAAMSVSAVGRTGAANRALLESQGALAAERQDQAEEQAKLDLAETLWREVDASLAPLGLEAGMGPQDLEAWLERGRERQRLARAMSEVETQRAEIEKERNELEAAIDVLESRRETLPILIDPTGLSRHLDPWFIECDAGGATAYRTRDGLEYFIPFEAIASAGDFARYLRRVEALPGALVVLLVRPDGLATMSRAESVIRRAGVRVARLPLPGDGELDWSLLRRAEGGD